MSTHNICFHAEIRKNINILWLKKSALSRTKIQCKISRLQMTAEEVINEVEILCGAKITRIGPHHAKTHFGAYPDITSHSCTILPKKS